MTCAPIAFAIVFRTRRSSTLRHLTTSSHLPRPPPRPATIFYTSRRQLEREERLRWEATKELRRRRRRRARAVALAPSFSPELRRKASKRGFFTALPPGIRDVPSGIGLTARKLVDTLRARATKHYSSDLSTPKWLNLYKKTKGPAEASSAAKRARTSYQ